MYLPDFYAGGRTKAYRFAEFFHNLSLDSCIETHMSPRTHTALPRAISFVTHKCIRALTVSDKTKDGKGEEQ